NLAITDDVLVQSIGELRRALGEDGTRLIKTIPRRGYRLESEVAFVASTDQLSATDASLSVAPVAVSEPISSGTRKLSGWLGDNLASRGRGWFAVLTLVLIFAAAAGWMAISSNWELSRQAGAKPAIAVLPMVNQSGDSDREYFSDGLTQDIISALGRFSELTVLSWNAVRPYKEKPASPEQIGRTLAVAYLVEGS